MKNQSITLKLDQALKQKEIYKSRCDELNRAERNRAQTLERQGLSAIAIHMYRFEDVREAVLGGVKPPKTTTTAWGG